jgi:hypothetical protein
MFKEKGRYIAEAYFMYLAPDLNPDRASIGKFKKLLQSVESESIVNSHLVQLIKEKIDKMNKGLVGRQLS